MSYDECIATVKREWLARLACADGDVPYVVPVQYAFAGDKLYAFTLPGKKLTIMRKNPHVCLQIDQLKDYDDDQQNTQYAAQPPASVTIVAVISTTSAEYDKQNDD